MRHLTRLFLMLGLAALLQGCQTGLPGSVTAPEDGVTPNAVLGGEIEVVALDAPLSDPAAAAPPESSTTAAAQEAAPSVVEDPAPAPLPDLPADAAGEVEDEALPPEAAAEPKSEAQIACEKKRGQWLATGLGKLKTCVFTTKDGGKRCTRESQCEGVCLARSGTCAPIRPLLGCNEILQDNGARVTQCIE